MMRSQKQEGTKQKLWNDRGKSCLLIRTPFLSQNHKNYKETVTPGKSHNHALRESGPDVWLDYKGKGPSLQFLKKTPASQSAPNETPQATWKGRQVLIYMLNCIPKPVAGVTGQHHQTCSRASLRASKQQCLLSFKHYMVLCLLCLFCMCRSSTLCKIKGEK